jgi:hypothetical protein
MSFVDKCALIAFIGEQYEGDVCFLLINHNLELLTADKSRHKYKHN